MSFKDKNVKKEYDKKYYQKNKAKIQKLKRNRALINQYNITLKNYNSLLESQNGVCAICGEKETIERFGCLSVDHCHETNKVRGLLCNKCNRGLGFFKDDPLLLFKAIKYLKGGE